jgi:flagellar motor switch protein FliN/FliY
MGNSATALNMLLNRKVTITTPTVGVYEPSSVLKSYTSPLVAINVEFTEGLYGKNLLLLKDYDAALVTDLLMGGDGNIDADNIVLTEIHFSAIGEVMNQMMGTAATAMSNMMGSGIQISPPNLFRIETGDNVSRFLDGATPVVQVSFDIEIEGLLKSKLLQIMSIKMAKEQIISLMHIGEEETVSVTPVKQASRPEQKAAQSTVKAAVQNPGINKNSSPQEDKQQVKAVKSASFDSFDVAGPNFQDMASSNYDLINDIPLQVMVELGRTRKSLGEVLNFGVGSIIVMDKQAGELVDVIVNGKRIAKGEVVVVDENYGVRITELIKGS